MTAPHLWKTHKNFSLFLVGYMGCKHFCKATSRGQMHTLLIYSYSFIHARCFFNNDDLGSALFTALFLFWLISLLINSFQHSAGFFCREMRFEVELLQFLYKNCETIDGVFSACPLPGHRRIRPDRDRRHGLRLRACLARDLWRPELSKWHSCPFRPDPPDPDSCFCPRSSTWERSSTCQAR